jgi:tyrosinase
VASVLVRRDIWSLELEQEWHPITAAYALAIDKMTSLDSEKSGSWAYQAAIHGMNGAPDDYRNQCQHNTWFFLPWHRMYLFWFERIVRAVIADLEGVSEEVKEAWALPYWNYGRGENYARLPDSFLADKRPDGTDNPLHVANRNPDIAAGGPLDPFETSDSALDEPVFAPDDAHASSFGGAVTKWNHFDESPGAAPGALEITPHGDVHVHVGGFMGGFNTAPLDPVFWLHHANIDRLWSEWLRDSSHANPSGANWGSDQTFAFHDEDGSRVESQPGEVVDTEQMGYRYDDDAEVRGRRRRRRVTEERRPEGPPQFVGSNEDRIVLSGDAASVSVPLNPPDEHRRRRGGQRPQRVYLHVSAIEGDRPPSVPYGVFLNVPHRRTRDASFDSHHVGNVPFFGIEKASDLDEEHAGGHGLRYTFDVTDVVNELRASDRWDEDEATVSFVPLRGSGEVEGEESQISVGKVSFYYQ